MDIEELVAIEKHSCPGSGTCSGMFTANTMSTCIEAMGVAIPNSSATPALNKSGEINEEVIGNCKILAQCLFDIMEKNTRVRDILTKQAFDNAIVVMMDLGGSTNGVLYLLVLAKEAEMDLSADCNNSFQRIQVVGRREPSISRFNILCPDWKNLQSNN